MNKQKYKCLLVSDFNIENFGGYLCNDIDSPAEVSTGIKPFHEVEKVILTTHKLNIAKVIRFLQKRGFIVKNSVVTYEERGMAEFAIKLNSASCEILNETSYT